MLQWLIVFSISFSIGFASEDYTIDQGAIDRVKHLQGTVIKSNYPKLQEKLTKIKSIRQEYENSEEGTAIYLFVSESVPLKTFKTFVIEASVLKQEYGVEFAFVLQGVCSSGYTSKIKELNKILSEYSDGNLFVENSVTIFDPYIFKSLKIKKVPVMAIATYKKDAYPTDSDILYVMRGDKSPLYFFHTIKKDNMKYENYFNSIASLY